MGGICVSLKDLNVSFSEILDTQLNYDEKLNEVKIQIIKKILKIWSEWQMEEK